jgi:hypothetical protein
VEGAAELRASRARLVEVAQAERRRLERALHNGVQQDLIAISLRLQLIREALETDVPRALGLLDEARVDSREALDRVRALAGDIYPSLLPAWGLPDSLREGKWRRRESNPRKAPAGRIPSLGPARHDPRFGGSDVTGMPIGHFAGAGRRLGVR